MCVSSITFCKDFQLTSEELSVLALGTPIVEIAYKLASLSKKKPGVHEWRVALLIMTRVLDVTHGPSSVVHIDTFVEHSALGVHKGSDLR